jgi:hypothetical protein
MNGKTVHSAWNVKGAKKGHKQSCFGVALAKAIGEHCGSWYFIGAVVSKGDFIADKIVGGFYLVYGFQGLPFFSGDQVPEGGMIKIQQGRSGKQFFHDINAF